MKVIIITGTPGAGKSTLAKKLAQELKFQRVDLHKYYKVISTGYNKKKQSYDIDIKKLRIFPADAFSHSEEYLKELRWMGIVSALVPGIDLSASTGIHNGTVVLKQILAGATTAQMCTALYKKGGDAISNAIADLNLFMDSQGFKNISDFKGKLNYSNIENPEKFERVQFMKSFGSK